MIAYLIEFRASRPGSETRVPGSNLGPGPVRSDPGPNGSKFEGKGVKNGQFLPQLCTRNFRKNNITQLIFVVNSS